MSPSIKKQLVWFILSAFVCFNTPEINAQNTPTDLPWTAGDCGILIPGIAAITCGVSESQNQADRFTFGLLDLNGAVPAAGRTEVTNNQDVYHHPSWHIDSIGLVYGVEINPAGDILLTASSNYGSGFWGQTAELGYGGIGGGTNTLTAAGTVYIIDGVTGQASVFAVLPQQTTTLTHWDCELNTSINRTSGQGLGNIAYDEINDQYFVSNIEDGRIYRLDANGNILDSYDPGVYDNGAPGISIMNDLVYGLAVEPGSGRLFYGGVDSDSHPDNSTTTGAPSVYSIDLNGSGGFVGSVNNTILPAGATYDNYVGNETFHNTLNAGGGNTYTANTQYFISDLEFTPSGQLLAGTRVGCENSFQSSYNHWGETSLLTLNGGNNLYDTDIDYDISVTGDAGVDDNYGGVAYYELADGSVQYAVSSADIIQENGPHGIAIFPSTASTTGLVTPLGAISYGTVDNAGNGDPKGFGGEIDIFNECIECPVITAFTDDNKGDYCYIGTPIDVTYAIQTDIGSTPNSYCIIWTVDGVVQTDTDSLLTLSLEPTENPCIPLASPVVTAQLVCKIKEDTSIVFNNSSAAFEIFYEPRQNMHYQAVNNGCSVEIVDLCGNLTITNDQGTGSNYTYDGTNSTNVDFSIRNVNSPEGCDATEQATLSCVDLSLDKAISTSTPNIGDPIVFTLTVANDGNAPATNVEVTDLLPSGLTYISDNSANAYNSGTGIWTIPSIPVGGTATIDITASVDVDGVLTNTAEITRMDEVDLDSSPGNGNIYEDDYATVCLSVPIQVCQEEPFSIELMAPPGLSTYQWYKDGVLITGETSSKFIATEEGTYTYTVDGAGPTGDCEGELCCPVVIEAIECCAPIDCVPVQMVILKNQY